jgi:hypothetical protein
MRKRNERAEYKKAVVTFCPAIGLLILKVVVAAFL